MIDRVIVHENPDGTVGVTTVLESARMIFEDGSRESDDAAAAREAERIIPPGTSFIITRKSELPRMDKLWRNQWRLNGVRVEIDMPAARGEKMAQIREKRNAKLKELDVEVLRAIESEDLSQRDLLKAKKQVLRDLPRMVDLDSIDDPDDLDSYSPVELD